MILLVLAIICLGGAVYMIGQLVTLPAQERQRFIKHVADVRRASARGRSST